MPEKRIHKLFPTPIFECKIESYKELNKDLENYIYNLEKKMQRVLKPLMREDGIPLIGKLQKAQKQENLSMQYLQFYMKL